MTNANNKKTMKKKLISAIAMLTVSAVTLSTATYAWFTMNKEVSVIGMEMKAHAEEGLLINEVKAASDDNWDEQAQAAASPVTYVLRPASTANLTNWWHANSKKSNDEAGVDTLGNTVKISDGVYYTDISPANVRDYVAISETEAAGGSQAETHVYYKDASFGNTSGTCEEGEGFYVNYKYYLKASSTTDLTITSGNLGVTVTAELKDNTATSTALDNSLRVGVKIGNDVKIFAPIVNAGSGTTDTSYNVTSAVSGSGTVPVTAFTAKTGINTSDIVIPKVTGDASGNGLLVDVYVWFEGEDQNCMSDNLTATLNAYKIQINFTDDDDLY